MIGALSFVGSDVCVLILQANRQHYSLVAAAIFLRQVAATVQLHGARKIPELPESKGVPAIDSNVFYKPHRVEDEDPEVRR
ncbi:hypothetical protein [Xanthomonas arboricola]